MWELDHMSDESLESDVARVRDSPRPFWRGVYPFLGGSEESLRRGRWNVPLVYYVQLGLPSCTYSSLWSLLVTVEGLDRGLFCVFA